MGSDQGAQHVVQSLNSEILKDGDDSFSEQFAPLAGYAHGGTVSHYTNLDLSCVGLCLFPMLLPCISIISFKLQTSFTRTLALNPYQLQSLYFSIESTDPSTGNLNFLNS